MPGKDGELINYVRQQCKLEHLRRFYQCKEHYRCNYQIASHLGGRSFAFRSFSFRFADAQPPWNGVESNTGKKLNHKFSNDFSQYVRDGQEQSSAKEIGQNGQHRGKHIGDGQSDGIYCQSLQCSD